MSISVTQIECRFMFPSTWCKSRYTVGTPQMGNTVLNVSDILTHRTRPRSGLIVKVQNYDFLKLKAVRSLKSGNEVSDPESWGKRASCLMRSRLGVWQQVSLSGGQTLGLQDLNLVSRSQLCHLLAGFLGFKNKLQFPQQKKEIPALLTRSGGAKIRCHVWKPQYKFLLKCVRSEP